MRRLGPLPGEDLDLDELFGGRQPPGIVVSVAGEYVRYELDDDRASLR